MANIYAVMTGPTTAEKTDTSNGVSYTCPANGTVNVPDAHVGELVAKGWRVASMTSIDSGDRGASQVPLNPSVIATAGGALATKPKLLKFHYGLASRNLAPCDSLFITDSLGEGSNATAKPRRYQDRTRDLLRARFPVTGVAGGDGFIPANWYQTSFTKPCIHTGGSTDVQDRTKGPGGRTWRLKASSDGVLTYAGISGTSFKLMYQQSTGTGHVSVQIDGGTVTDIDTFNNSTVVDGQLSASIPLTAGSHTITIKWLSGNDVFINGIMVYNGDETVGIRNWDAAHFGYDSSDHMTSPPANWLSNIAPTTPLVIIELGANDCVGIKNASGTGIDIPPATYAANLQTLIANIRTATVSGAAYSPNIVLLTYIERSDIAGHLYPWAAYVAAAKGVADADSMVSMLDLTQRMPSVANSPSGWYSGTVHPLDITHSLIAEYLVAFISPN